MLQVKSDVLAMSLLSEESLMFYLPQPQLLQMRRIIVATCAAAGKIWFECIETHH